MPILMTVCGLATIAGAGYIGALSLEALADDLVNHYARWSYVWADLLGLGGAVVTILTALYAIACAWLP